jgi:hypothetical protein
LRLRQRARRFTNDAKFTITDQGSMVGTGLSGGVYTPIETVNKVKCSNLVLHYQIDVMVEVISPQQDNNDWQIAAYVDGMPAAYNPTIGWASTSTCRLMSHQLPISLWKTGR